jgi:hypothetical protein
MRLAADLFELSQRRQGSAHEAGLLALLLQSADQMIAALDNILGGVSEFLGLGDEVSHAGERFGLCRSIGVGCVRQ